MIINVFATYSTVYNRGISFEDFKDILNKFNRKFLLEILIKVDCVFLTNGYFDKDCQIFCIKNIFPPSMHEFIFSRLQRIGVKDKPAVIFSRQQVHNLIKLSIVYSNNSTNPNANYISKDFGDLFLMMNEFYDSLIKNDTDMNETNEYLIRNYLYNAEDAYRKKIYRFHKLFVTLPALIGKSNYNKIFENITGFEIEKYMAIGFSFLAHWSKIDYNNLTTLSSYINGSTYFEKTTLSTEEIKSTLTLFCDDIEVCSSNIQKQINTSKNWQLEFDIQNNKPLFEIPDVGTATHGLSFLQDKITDNIYWNILDNLSKEEGDAFLRDFGEVFEKYIFDILKRTFKEKAFKIKYDHDNKEVGDCVVEIKRNIFIFEVKSGRLTKEIYTTGKIDKLFEALKEKLVLRPLNQLSKVISDFKDNKFKVGNLSWDKTVRIFPICVTFKELPQLPGIREELENIIKTETLFEYDKVKQFQIMDTEEIEILETLLGKYFQKSKFLDIMLHKCGNFSLRSMSFKNYLYEKTAFASFNEESDEIRTSYFEMGKRFSELLGLPSNL